MKKIILLSIVLLISIFSFGQFTGTNKTINSGDLRFGNGSELSINNTGNVQQPFYNLAGNWRKLTYSTLPLDYAFAQGGDGTSEWNINGTRVINPVMSNQVFDESGFIITSGSVGYGTLKVKGTIVIGTATFEVTNSYTTGQADNYVSVVTTIKNVGTAPINNLRFWIGTRDDWVGDTDQPTRTRGNLVNGAFTPLTATTQRAAALLIKTGTEGVMFFTNSNRGNNVHNVYTGAWEPSIDLNPSTAVIENTSDGNYAMYVRMNDLAVGATDSFNWYYAAASLTELEEVVAAVADASSSVQNITSNSATLNGSSSVNATGYYVVVPQGSTAPTAAQIMAGTTYGGVTVVNSGNQALTAGVSAPFSLTNLLPLTNYTVYFVTQYLDTNSVLVNSAVTSSNFTTLYTCAAIDQRSNGNGQASLCPGVSGTPTNASVTSTVYANVPVTAKTGTIRFKYSATSLPGIIPAINRIWINGVQSTVQAGPPSVVTTSGADYLVSYCFYNINLPNAGSYTLEFVNPLTGDAVGRCTFDGSSNVTTTEPTLLSNTNPTISVITNQTVCQAATPATVNFTIGDAETTDLTLMTVTATSSNTALLPNANLVLGGTTSARTLNYTFAAGQTGTATITITVVDPSGGTATRTFTTTHLTSLVLNAASQTNVACNGGTTGAASVSAATGGAGRYTYNWTPGNPTGDGTVSVTGLTAGTWTCTVTDANGCTTSQNFTVTQPTALALTTASQTNVSCNGGSNGAASVNAATGGAGGYTYNWTPGNPTGDGTVSVTGLTAGTWTCTVTDTNGCTTTRNFTITQPTVLALTTAAQTNVSCNAGSNGAASVNAATGGTGPYTYNWTPGNPTGDGTVSVTGLTAGTWTCTVTDANGCTTSQNFTVTQPTALALTSASQTNVSCNGGSNGAASVNAATGGTGPYTYNWTPGNPTGDGTVSVTGLTIGVWTCTVTDANGCTTTRNFTITQPTALVLTAASQTNVSCNGGSNGSATVGVSGGTTPYTYSWSPSGGTAATASGLSAGTYTVTVTDANGCSGTQSFTITQPTALSIASNSQTQESCVGANDATATVSISGGTGGYTYSWSSSGGTAAIASGLTAGTYTVTATDANGCTISQVYTITTVLDVTNPTIIAPADVTENTDTACTATGVALGTPIVADNCTVASYSSDAPAIFPFGTTVVTWTVTDGLGNTASATQNVTVTDVEVPNVITQDITVQLDINGAATITPSMINDGSTDNCGIDTITLSDLSFDCSNVGSNTVTLTVTDINGNVASNTAVVTVEDNIDPTVITQDITLNWNGSGQAVITFNMLNNGSSDNCSIASITVSQTNFDCTNLGANTVTLTVTDANGNPNTATATGTVIDTTNPVAIGQNITLSLDANGQLILDPALIDNGSYDNCNSTITASPNIFGPSNIGVNNVILVITDSSGNTNFTTVQVTIIDTVNPVVNTQNITINLDSNGSATITANQVNNGSTDNAQIASMSVAPNTFTCDDLGTNTVTLTVTDTNGNSSTGSATVTVSDATLPTITAPAAVNVTTDTACTATAVVLGNAVTADNCSVASVSNDAPAVFALGTTTVTWTVVDGSGNTATATQLVTVTDATNPTITAPSDITINTNDDCYAINVALGTPVTADNCSVVSVTNDAPASFSIGSTTVTWTIVDGSGNTATATQVVTVSDATLPTITAPIAINVTTDTACTATAVVLGNAVTTDNCSVVSVTNDAPAAFPLGTTTVTWTVVDGSGNTATATQLVTVTDATNPTITAPSDITINTNDDCYAINVALGTRVKADKYSVG